MLVIPGNVSWALNYIPTFCSIHYGYYEPDETHDIHLACSLGYVTTFGCTSMVYVARKMNETIVHIVEQAQQIDMKTP